MAELKQDTVAVKGLPKLHTYPASTLSVKYGLPVDVIRSLKFGGQVQVKPSIAMALKTDGLVASIQKKRKEK